MPSVSRQFTALAMVEPGVRASRHSGVPDDAEQVMLAPPPNDCQVAALHCSTVPVPSELAAMLPLGEQAAPLVATAPSASVDRLRLPELPVKLPP